jgi:peptidyl-dipeptidase A
MDQSPHRLVEMLEQEIEGLETRFHAAYWDAQTASTVESTRRRVDLEVELRELKGDPVRLKAVEVALEEELHDGSLRRQLEVLRLSMISNQMDEDRRARLVEISSTVESDFATHRPTVDGKPLNDNEIEHILRMSEDDALRRRAWGASKEIGAIVAPRVRELARIRNSVALDLGFADFYSMALELQELPEEWLFELLVDVEKLTEEPFRIWKEEVDDQLRARFGTRDVRPWHYADPFFQQLPEDGSVSLDPLLGEADAAELAHLTFNAWGIDLSGVMRASDLYPRADKSQHAFCLDVNRSGRDVRILANVVPGERWVEVMLHESGHAAYDVSIDRHLPYLLRRPTHTFVTEAAAILSGRLARDPEWLVQVAGADSRKIAGIGADLDRSRRAQMLLFVRWALVVCHFERELYRNPEADLDALWWELVERFQLIPPPPDRSAPDWAAKVHVATAPVYYQNYLLGELLASQIRATCERECGGFVGRPEVGELLVKRLFHPGALLRWDSLIEESTGRELRADEFAADLTSSPSF